jgi:Ser/Thr protein kinase RdoA (MazF antagonist)
MHSPTENPRPILAGPPNLSTEELAKAVSLQFGLAGDYTELISERDRNFRLRTRDGKSYVVKATCLAEDAIVTDFQISALIHLENRGVTFVPRIVRTPSGRDRGSVRSEDGSELCLRVVTWLSGELLRDVDVTAKIAQRFGRRLAELNVALEDFSHDGEAQTLLWDSQRAGELRGLLGHINDKAVRESVEAVLDDFDSRVKPALPDLPQQVIHNDANDENVLLDESGDVSGIIDFGDMMKAPRVIDIATAASYLRTPDDPLRLIEPFAVAYNRENALLGAEFDVLFDLIRTRLSMTLIILHWRLAARDEDDPYRQKSLAANSNALDFLQKLSNFGREAFIQRILR